MNSGVPCDQFKSVPTKSPKPRIVQPSVRLPDTGSDDSVDRLDPGNEEGSEPTVVTGQSKQVYNFDLFN